MTAYSGALLPPVELTTLDDVPDSHTWTSLHERPYGDDPIPVVDLADPDAVTLIGRACEEWGAFQLTGHGAPVDLLERVQAQSRRLFALPHEQKLKAASLSGSFLNGGYGLVKINAFYTKTFWSEGFTIIGSPLDHARILWPDDYAEFCETMEEYETSMRDLSRRLVRMALGALGLGEEDIDATGGLGGSEKTIGMQLNHYPTCPEPDRALGLADHTDSGLITLLYQGSVSGLQLLRAGRWVTVPPIPGALIVLLGDVGEIISNGRFKSVLHRAMVNTSRSRISTVYFSGPPDGFLVAPIEKLVQMDGAPAFRSLSLLELMNMKQELYLKTLDTLRLPAEKKEDEEIDAN